MYPGEKFNADLVSIFLSAEPGYEIRRKRVVHKSGEHNFTKFRKPTGKINYSLSISIKSYNDHKGMVGNMVRDEGGIDYIVVSAFNEHLFSLRTLQGSFETNRLVIQSMNFSRFTFLGASSTVNIIRVGPEAQQTIPFKLEEDAI